MEPLTLSASQLQTYLGCGLRYRFRYIDRIPPPWRPAVLSFGTAIHAAAEHFQRERMCGREPDPASILQYFHHVWDRENVQPLVFSDRESREGLAAKGAEMLRVYLDAQAGTPVPKAVEQPFEVPLHDPETGEVLEVSLRGVIDLIEADGTVVDLKTAGRALETGGLDRHVQLSCYALAQFIETGELPALRLDMLFKTAKPRFDRLSTTRTVADLAWVAQLIREVAYAIETEHFFPNPSWRCSECEYFAHCQAWRGWVPQPEAMPVAESREGAGAAVA